MTSAVERYDREKERQTDRHEREREREREHEHSEAFNSPEIRVDFPELGII